MYFFPALKYYVITEIIFLWLGKIFPAISTTFILSANSILVSFRSIIYTLLLPSSLYALLCFLSQISNYSSKNFKMIAFSLVVFLPETRMAFICCFLFVSTSEYDITRKTILHTLLDFYSRLKMLDAQSQNHGIVWCSVTSQFWLMNLGFE